MKYIKGMICTVAIGLILVTQLMSPVLAYADGEITPAPTDTQAATPTPLPTDAPTDIVPSETSTPDPLLTTTPASPSPIDAPVATVTPGPSTETPEISATPEPTEAPTEAIETVMPTLDLAETATPAEDANVAEQLTLLEVVQEVPGNTSVVVLDENGQPLSLASQATADIIANSDPVWCPDTVPLPLTTPTPGVDGCSAYYGTLAELVFAIDNGIDPYVLNNVSDGTIWITAGTVADTSAVTIDGCRYSYDPYYGWYCSGLTNWSNYSLTLQGGWSGNNGDASIGLSSEFSVPISILNWNNDVTVNNVTINNSPNGGLLVTSWSPDTDVNINSVGVNGAAGFGLGIDIYGGNVTIDKSTFSNTVEDYNGNSYYPWGDGADIFTYGGNITITNSHFDDNDWAGIYTSGGTGQIDIKNSAFNLNNIGGLEISYAAGITVADTEFTGNPDYDISVFCKYPIDPFYNYQSLLFDDTILGATPDHPTLVDFSIDNNCKLSNYLLKVGNATSTANPKQGFNPRFQSRYITLASRSRSEFNISCSDGQTSFTVPLPNGDKVEIVCPVHGMAAISRLDNTILPDQLPAGYTYASAFQLDISKITEPFEMVNGELLTELVPVITEGGYIKASFVPTPLQVGRTYAVLFWDANTLQWIPLKDFAFGHSFPLFPDNPADKREIRSGVQFVSSGAQRIEVSTNFPGIFVLAQH
jgi:sulfur carrier protein ThiS